MPNVYNRPLFMQAGGAIDPAQMAMQSPEGQYVQQAEQQAMQAAAPLGAAYAENMMQGLDQSEDFESMINSIRGNQMPLEARYNELAGMVGQEDASATPESVLALVQPTIMMTEQGAMDSGIGELMQQVAGAAEMQSPETTDQGLGSLLAAGQQAPVNFNLGGPVQKYANGMEVNSPEKLLAARGLLAASGNDATFYGPGLTEQQGDKLAAMAKPRVQVPSLESLYEKSLPLYEKILGRDKNAQDMSKANILFDIARRSLAFAGGVNPDTGANMADQPLAAQFAQAAQTLPTTLQGELANKAKTDQAIKLGALEAAQGQRKALLDASLETYSLSEGQVRYDALGNVIAKGPDKGPEYTTAAAGSRIYKDGVLVDTVPAKPEKMDLGYIVVDGVTQDTFNMNDPTEKAAAEEAIRQASAEGREAFIDKTRPTNEATERLKRSITSSNLLDRIENGTATEDDISLWLTNVQDYARAETIEQKTATGNTVKIKKASRGLPPRTEQVLKDKFPDIHARIFSEPSVFTDRRVYVPDEPNVEDAKTVAQSIDPIAYKLNMTVYQPLNQSGVFPLRIQQTFKEFDYSKAAGLEGAYTTVLDTFVDFFTDELADDGEAARAKAAVAGLKLDLEKLAAESYPGGRAPVQFLEQFRLIQPQFGQLLVGNAQNLALMEKLTQVLGEMEINAMQSAYGNYDDKVKQQGIMNLNAIRPVLAKAMVIKASLEKSVGKLGGDVESILLEGSSSSEESLLDKYDLNKKSNSRKQRT